MDYGALLADSWKTIWKHKVLLAFGSLTGLPLLVGLVLDALMADMWDNLFFGTNSAGELALSLLALAILLLTGLLTGVLVQSAILYGVREALGAGAPIRFGRALARSVGFLWRVLGVWVIVGVTVLVMLVTAIGCQLLFAAVTMGLSLICLLPFYAGVLLCSGTANIIEGLTAAAVVLDDVGIRSAFRRTWDTLRTRTAPAIVVGIVLTLIYGISTGLLAGPEILAAYLPLLLATAKPALTAQIATVNLLLRLAYLPVHVFGLAVASAFVYCGWALAYRRLAHPVAPQEEA